MKKICLIILLVTASFGIRTYGQSDTSMKAWMDYMQPGEFHKLLAVYNGDFDEEVTMWMTPGAPPTVSTSTSKNEMIMGGRYQKSINKGDMMGMPFEGMSITGYDNAKKVFTSMWIDNFGTGTMLLTGPYDPKTKTITLRGNEVDPMTGKDLLVKETFQLIDKDHEIIEMYTLIGDKEIKNMSIKVTRKK